MKPGEIAPSPTVYKPPIQQPAPQPAPLTRTQLIEQGYRWEPSGYQTYGVPQDIGMWVKEVPAKPQQEAQLPGGIRHLEQSLEEQGGVDPWSSLEKQLPQGAKMLGYKEVPGGYEVSYEMPQQTWKETTIAGQALAGTLEPGPVSVLRYLGLPSQAEGLKQWYKEQEWWMQPFGTKEVSKVAAAGFFAIPESTYKVGKGLLTGVWEPSAPTFMGAMINPRERAEFVEMGPAYWAGSLFASGLEAIAFGKGMELGYRGVKAVTPEAVKYALSSAKESIRFSRVAQVWQKASLELKGALPSFKGSRAEMWLIENIPQYQKHAAKQLTKAEFGAMLPERIGMENLKIEETIFKLASYPHGQVVYLSKLPFEKSLVKSLPHLFFRQGSMSIGYLTQPLSFIQREATFTPFVSQTQVTRMGIQPYIPKTISTFAKAGSSLSTVLGIGASTLTRSILKPPQAPTILTRTIPIDYEEEKIKVRPQELFRYDVLPQQRERAVPVPKLSLFTQPLSNVKIDVVQQQQTQQLMIPQVASIFDIPSPTRQRQQGKAAFPGLPRLPEAFTGGGQRGLFGKYWMKKHPIPTPKQVLGFEIDYGLGKKRKRRKARKR